MKLIKVTMRPEITPVHLSVYNSYQYFNVTHCQIHEKRFRKVHMTHLIQKGKFRNIGHATASPHFSLKIPLITGSATKF